MTSLRVDDGAVRHGQGGRVISSSPPRQRRGRFVIS